MQEYRGLSLPFGYSVERIIDDWVFLAMLVGRRYLLLTAGCCYSTC